MELHYLKFCRDAISRREKFHVKFKIRHDERIAVRIDGGDFDDGAYGAVVAIGPLDALYYLGVAFFVELGAGGEVVGGVVEEGSFGWVVFVRCAFLPPTCLISFCH